MFDIQENLKKLPDTPGVYLHKNKLGEVIYVGKAVSLRNRVRQYFQSPKRLEPKVRAMVSHIAEFEYITAGSEMEALILECNLIKKYMPKYNILLRDDKTYPYVKVTLNEDYPRLVKTRRLEHDGAKYFGPYADAGAVNQIIDLLNHIYRLKRCAARKFTEGAQPCLNYHIHQCRGICTGQIGREEYMEAVRGAMDFFQGKDKQLLANLQEEMEKSAAELNFERAAECRDYISAITSLMERQRVTLLGAADMDVVLTVKGAESSHVILFFVREGKLSGRESFCLNQEAAEDKAEIVEAFIKQHYSANTAIPQEILLESSLPGEELLSQWLSELRGSKVRLLVPQKGEKKALLELARRDVIEMMKVLDERAKNQRERQQAAVRALSSFLGIEKEKWRVEAYDISNTNGLDSVGAMVVFEDGRPVRRDYRRFKIKTVEGADDYASLQEVLYRRMKRGLSGDAGFSVMPDLLLMDGGAKQVEAVEKVLSAMKVAIPVAGMVKDEHHRTRGLTYRGQELDLKQTPELFRYIGTIQEEVHRFAIEYHRGLRGKAVQRSVLDEISGVGAKRRGMLLTHFGSVDAIRQADVEMLAKAPGMNRAVAESVHDYFASHPANAAAVPAAGQGQTADLQPGQEEENI